MPRATSIPARAAKAVTTPANFMEATMAGMLVMAATTTRKTARGC